MRRDHPLLQGRAKGVNVSLPEAMRKALLERAYRDDRSQSYIVKMALLQYLTKESRASNGQKATTEQSGG